MSHPHDSLPQTPAVSALVRRITMRLSGELAFNGHPTLSQVEVAGMFNLADASSQLDRISILPGMAQHENRARRDLLEIYDIFNPLEALADSFESGQHEREAAHHAALDARENAGDAQGCQP